MTECFFKTASLQVRFFTINDIIASVVAVKFEKAFCYGQDLTSGNPCAKFCLIPINTDGGFRVMQSLQVLHCSVRRACTYKHIHNLKHIHNK